MRRIALLVLLSSLVGCTPRPAPPAEPGVVPEVILQPPSHREQEQHSAPMPAQQPAPTPESEIPTVEQVKKVIRFGDCANRIVEGPTWDELQFLSWGSRAFPACEAMLTDPECDPLHAAGACDIICLVKGDRERFIPLLLRRLRDPDALLCVGVTNVWGGKKLNEDGLTLYRNMVRQAAIYALGEIGDERVTEFIFPFLSDPDGSTRREALEALPKIGGKRDLEALDALLGNAPPVRDPNYIKKLQRCREALDARLKANPASRKT